MKRGYGRQWEKIRLARLQREPWWRACKHELANEADDIVTKRRGGTDDFSNLQSLCKRDHSRKTATQPHEDRRAATGERMKISGAKGRAYRSRSFSAVVEG